MNDAITGNLTGTLLSFFHLQYLKETKRNKVRLNI